MKISFLSLDFFSLTLKIFLALLGGAIAPSPLSTPAWKLNRPAVAGARVTHVKATFRENSNKLACSDLPAVDILNHIRKGSSDAASDYQHSSNLFFHDIFCNTVVIFFLIIQDGEKWAVGHG